MELMIAEKYKITAELGRGSMGMVYKATHKSLGREDALKVLHPTLSGDKDFLQRFAREAQSMARLDHLNIVRVYDSFEFDQKYYIAMEYFDGFSIASILKNKRLLSVSQVLSIISQATSGLAYAHARGVVHLDINPENMMVNTAFRLKLTDFGIATAKNEFNETTDSGEIFGSPSYMSPEQARGSELDNRSDLYSLGMVFYELINGRKPFQGDTGVSIIKRLAYEDKEIVLDFNNKIPEKIQGIIRKLTHRDPNMRFQDASALQAELAEAMGDEKIQEAKESSIGVAPLGVSANQRFATPPIATKNSRTLTWMLVLTLFLVSGSYAYVSQNTFLPRVVSLFDFRPATAIAEENQKQEVNRMHVHLLDHETAAIAARKNIDESTLTTIAKKIFDEAVKVQIDGTTELAEAVGHMARSEYDEAQFILLTAEAFFEEAEKQFMLANEATELASSASVVEGLLEEATLLQQEVKINMQNAMAVKADERKVSEFTRGLFYQEKAGRLFVQSQQYVEDSNRLKSRVRIDETIAALTTADKYFKEARRVAVNLDYEDSVEDGLAEFTKLRLIVTTSKIDAEHNRAAIQASSLFEKADALNEELIILETLINSLLDKGRNRRAADRLESAIKLAKKVATAYLKATGATKIDSARDVTTTNRKTTK